MIEEILYNQINEIFDKINAINGVLLEKDKIIKRKLRFKNKFVYRYYIKHNFIKDFIPYSLYNFTLRKFSNFLDNTNARI